MIRPPVGRISERKRGAVTEMTPSERKIPTRRMSFEESLVELPKHFARDRDRSRATW